MTTIQNKLLVLVLMGFLGVGFNCFADEYYVGKAAKQMLVKAQKESPESFVVNYYLGMVYSNENNATKALEAWNKYLAQAPTDAKSISVREKMTQLKFAAAQEYASKMVKEKQKKLVRELKRTNKNTVAVINFNASTDNNLNLLSKGLTAMLITDLSRIPAIDIVEREKMQAILKEMKLSKTKLVNRKTATRAGRFLMAKKVIRGHLKRKAKDSLNINSTITDTLVSRDLNRTKVSGEIKNLFDLEKKLLNHILKAMAINKSKLQKSVREAIDKYHTTNMDAFLSYCRGLEFQDAGDFKKARSAFQKAIQLDPQFIMALEAANVVDNIGSANRKKELDVFIDVQPRGPIIEASEKKDAGDPLEILKETEPPLSAQDQMLDVTHNDNSNRAAQKSKITFTWD